MIAGFLFALPAGAAHLRSETLSAWDGYLDTTQANLQDRIKPGGCFLWTFEDPERVANVRAGEVVVAPAPGSSPLKVRGGLIHHWIGAVFVPGIDMEQVIEVTRDYDRYKEYYQPSVIESRTIARSDADDQFSMRIMNKTLLLKMALDADYHATYVYLDSKRIYSVSRTTRLQEIQEYGETAEHKMAEGEGDGYIWKLCSITRFEQRDGGVYVELEAVALSREIPLAARFFVDPIVRRVSRNSIFISLQQTREALNGNTSLSARRGGVPSGGQRGQSFLAK